MGREASDLAELKQAIARVAASLPEMGRSVPENWQQVRESLCQNERAERPPTSSEKSLSSSVAGSNTFTGRGAVNFR